MHSTLIVLKYGQITAGKSEKYPLTLYTVKTNILLDKQIKVA
ncbi:MAG: hypothetical protein A4E71_03031 [Smithella sp. PtaU1.Bin162]|nr:MAG: hypothetical protein A4E71_03031 [Smithella sp. PtaU1.Bin162]